jgi:ankyrin repeat protein
MNKISLFSIALRKTNSRELSSVTNAGGDQYVSNLIEPKRVRRGFITKNDVDSYSSDSLKVNISDLADAEELKKIAQVVAIHQQQKDSSLSFEQQSNNLIEDFHILNGFRTRSKEILTILSQKDRALHLLNYGEQDTGRKLLSIAAEADWYEGVLFLLNRGADINETDRENRTPLMDCLTSTNTNIITALIKKPECNLDIQSLTGHTATHYAVMMNVR